MSPPTADRAGAVIFAASGPPMLFGEERMDRPTIRRMAPLSNPPLVPTLSDGALTLCAVLDDARSHADKTVQDGDLAGGSANRLALAALTAIHAPVLVGHLLFFCVTAIFMAACFTIFSSQNGAAPDRRCLRMAAPASRLVPAGYATAPSRPGMILGPMLATSRPRNLTPSDCDPPQFPARPVPAAPLPMILLAVLSNFRFFRSPLAAIRNRLIRQRDG